MAVRIKTVHYSFPMFTGTVADAVVTNLTQTTIYIPEGVIGFTSVTAELGFQDIITATGGTLNEYRIGLRLGASAYTTVTETDDTTNTGENLAAVIGPFNFTTLFTASWTGTSMTTDAQVYFDQTTGTTLGMRNVTVTLHITYQYNDTTNATQLKTAIIPLESDNGALSSIANTNIGTDQIPQLTSGGMLPEAGVVIRDYFFLIEGNESMQTTTDLTVSANIDSGTATVFGIQEAALVSGRFIRWVYKPTAIPSSTATHNFQLWSSGGRFNHVTITLYVTYEFTIATTTRVLNTVVIPLQLNTPLAYTADKDRFTFEYHAEEPGTLTLMQSAFRINYNSGDLPALAFRAGSQGYRTYISAVGTSAGMYSFQQRIDSGSTQGLGVTSFARGLNTLVVDGGTTTTLETTIPTNVNGYIILNYESDLSSLGIGAHAHTIEKIISQWEGLAKLFTKTSSFLAVIPDAHYRLISAGYVMYLGTASTSMAISLDVNCTSSEGKGGGYYNVYSDSLISDGEIGSSIVYIQGNYHMKKYPFDQSHNDLIDFKTNHTYRIGTTAGSAAGLSALYTYHGLPILVSGTISGSAGGTVRISVYRSDNQTVLATLTRVGNGAFSFNWYDDTIPIYAEAYEDNTHYGRSINVTAGVTNPDVSLNTTGGGSPQVVARAFA